MNKTVVLVVEDDRPIRNLIVTTLKMHDYKYLTANNGVSAIMEASSHHPDIVLLDLGLPDMEGVDVIKKIRTWSNMPIIVISARSEDSDKIEALDSGADDYIIKPFNMDVLRLRIRSLLESRAQLKKLYGKRFSLDEMGIEVVSADERFSQKLFEVIEKNISDQNLGVEMLCQEIGISRANLYRKLKSITELSPTELIRNKRLEIAAKMLKESDMSVSEVAALLGFNSHSYFSNSFKSFYGYTPTEFIQKKQTGI